MAARLEMPWGGTKTCLGSFGPVSGQVAVLSKHVAASGGNQHTATKKNGRRNDAATASRSVAQVLVPALLGRLHRPGDRLPAPKLTCFTHCRVRSGQAQRGLIPDDLAARQSRISFGL